MPGIYEGADMKIKVQITAGIILITFFVLVAACAPMFAPHDPNTTNLAMKNAAPCMEYPFGCDQLGRDRKSVV